MKKLYSLLVLTLCLLWGVSASAQTVTFDFVANEWEHALGSGNGETAAAGNMEDPIVARSNNDGVELSFGKGSASQPPRYWTGPQLRVYNGNTITLKPLDASKAIVRVAFTAASGYFKFTTTTGTLDELTWTGNQNEVTFTGTGSSRLTSIEVTLADATDDTEVAGTTVQMPNITPRTNTNRTDSVIVTITGDEETSIYYTLDGTDPTDASTLYTAPFALYESATVKAIAYNATGASSAIAEVAYTITPSETTEPADPTDSQTSSYTFERTNTIESGKQYLLVAPVDGVYKVATLITRNYGYYYVTDVAAREDGTIVLDNLDNAFTIEATNEANVYTIKQSDGRYVYQTGSYNSFNLSADLVDGSNWLISASNDNNLTIRNVSVQKWIQYSTGYKSFGSYAEEVDGSVAAELWVLTQSEIVEPVDDPNVLFEEPATSTNNQLVIEDVALADGLSKVWSFSNTYGATASAYASGTNYDSESWLHLPVIDLPADAPARLTFEHSISRFFVDVNNEATLWIREVEVAPTQLATVDASWTQLNINYPTIVEGKNFSSFEIQELSLADFAGKSVEIAFRYVSTSEGAGTWEIRNIKVDTEPLTGISEILLPTTAQPAIYDLQGRRVTQPLTRGVYIVGGRKVYVK